jgi:hypothetical protein
LLDTKSLEYARSVARALLVKAKVQGKKYAVVIYHGEPVVRLAYGHRYGTLPRFWDDAERHNKLVGIYDRHADLEVIAEDIVATINGEYAVRDCVGKTQLDI